MANASALAKYGISHQPAMAISVAVAGVMALSIQLKAQLSNLGVYQHRRSKIMYQWQRQ
jgi:hypothetical protein